MNGKKYTGEELVEKWINEKRQYVSMNTINSYGLAGKIAVVILKEKYRATYVEYDDTHFCGGYTFKNPLGHYEERYVLYYMFECNKHLTSLMHNKDINELLDEIVRLEYENIYLNHKELIPQYRKMIYEAIHDNVYYKSRYWFIFKENIWVI